MRSCHPDSSAGLRWSLSSSGMKRGNEMKVAWFDGFAFFLDTQFPGLLNVTPDWLWPAGFSTDYNIPVDVQYMVVLNLYKNAKF